MLDAALIDVMSSSPDKIIPGKLYCSELKEIIMNQRVLETFQAVSKFLKLNKLETLLFSVNADLIYLETLESLTGLLQQKADY